MSGQAMSDTSQAAAPSAAAASRAPGAWTGAAEVAQCDARGEHERALMLLAEGAQRGNVDAMTYLGKRLLVGYQAPFHPQQGTELIVKAANLGGGAAAAQVA